MNKLEFSSASSLILYLTLSVVLVIIWQHIWKKEKNDFGLLFMASAIFVWAVVALVDLLYFGDHPEFRGFLENIFGNGVEKDEVFVFLRNRDLINVLF